MFTWISVALNRHPCASRALDALRLQPPRGHAAALQRSLITFAAPDANVIERGRGRLGPRRFAARGAKCPIDRATPPHFTLDRRTRRRTSHSGATRQSTSIQCRCGGGRRRSDDGRWWRDHDGGATLISVGGCHAGRCPVGRRDHINRPGSDIHAARRNVDGLGICARNVQ